MMVGMLNQVARWFWPMTFTTLGCLAAPAPDGSADDSQRHDPGAVEEVATSFVAGLPCTSNADCGLRFYCQYADGQCGGAGTCEARPRACTREFAPVCGCDDETYANVCVAASEGISIQDTGECRAAEAKCGAVVCDKGLECCNASCGVCVPPGESCTQEACE